MRLYCNPSIRLTPGHLDSQIPLRSGVADVINIYAGIPACPVECSLKIVNHADAQHRMLNVCFSFDVGRSMFDLRCSFFLLYPPQSSAESTTAAHRSTFWATTHIPRLFCTLLSSLNSTLRYTDNYLKILLNK